MKLPKLFSIMKKIFNLSKEIKDLETKLNNEIYFKAGDTYNINNHLDCIAFLTSGRTRLFINIVLPKRIDNVNINITELTGAVRNSLGGYMIEDNSDFLSIGKFDGYYKNANNLVVRYTMNNEMGNFNNNTLACVDIQKCTINFS